MNVKSSGFHYVGRYKSPLLYHYVIMPEVAGDGKLPPFSGNIVLDGHCFTSGKEWAEIKRRAKAATKNRDALFFTEVFKLADVSSRRILKDSKKIRTPREISVFFRHMNEMEYPWWITIPIGEGIEEFLAGDREFLNLPETVRQSFFSLAKKTRLVQQEEEMLKIRDKLRNAGLCFKLSDIKAKAPNLYAEIQRHVEKYRWFGMMHFWGEPFSGEKLMAQMELAKLERNNVKPKLNSHLEWIRGICENLGYWRQTCADTCAIVSLAAMEQFGKIGKDKGVGYGEIMWLTPPELVEYAKSGKLPDTGIVRQRQIAFGVIPKGNERLVLTGTELDKMLDELLPKMGAMSEVKGIAAHGGNVAGIARIVLIPDDLKKIMPGDILISNETTPDFVPVLGKVRGIVTDIGGIGSHAAIISRELGIPCIVGTKFATRVFKDGDYLEVDAGKGTVRKISKPHR